MVVPSEFIEDLRQRVTLSDLIGRRVKLVKKGRRHSGLCPFHSEKTPSFSVVDDDGFYHCFGCGVHGDAISFLREMDGLDFMEAIERLAGMAGLAMPRSATTDPAVTRQREMTLDVLEEATRFFESALYSDVGQHAARYLRQRAIDAATVKGFRLGYAPRNGLREKLASKGFSDADMLTAGMIRKSDHDKSLFDYFRDRVMFPIENRQGKVIAFGARALGVAQPKYLNSGEGPTFSKKSILYGWAQAREGLRRDLPLVVVEGYMDVIAIHRSGAAAAVAPLGTALTPEQIQLIWKLHDEPVLCFDGDVAGQRAQLRVLERLLPVLEPGRSVRFARLPEGKDPDDLINDAGVEGFKQIIATARSMIESLWDQMLARFDVSLPESRANFWQAVRGHVRIIGNSQVRSAYGDEIEGRIAAMRSQVRGTPKIGLSTRQARRPRTGLLVRHRAIIALILAHPELVPDNFEALSMLNSGDGELESLKKAVVDAVILDPGLDAEALSYHLRESNFERSLAGFIGEDMKARLPFDPVKLTGEEAAKHLNELLQLVGGKSGLFSQNSFPKVN